MLGADDRNKRVDGMLQKIDELKNEITLTFMRTQNLIISSYFDKTFLSITTLEEIENYRKKLYSFKDYLGCTEGYTFFNTYYVNKMEELERKYNTLENGEVETAIKVISKKENIIFTILRTIKKLILGNGKEKQILKD